mgnify:CR=1 FL=1
MKKVSVIIPVYNVKEYLLGCLGSVKDQTLADIEVILVDDGSTDGSGKILDEFANENGNAKVFHKKNGGLSSARNFGLAKAEGEYIIFLDSDDQIMPDACKRLYDEAENAGADMIVTACPLCKYNLVKNGSSIPVIYFTELLAEALGVKEDNNAE